jgi:hypothetical protein
VNNLLTVMQTKLTKSNMPFTPVVTTGPATNPALTPKKKK